MAFRPHRLRLPAALRTDQSILRVGTQARELVLFSRVSTASAGASGLYYLLLSHRACSVFGFRSRRLPRGVELHRGRVTLTVTDGRVWPALLKQARAVPGSQEKLAAAFGVFHPPHQLPHSSRAVHSLKTGLHRLRCSRSRPRNGARVPGAQDKQTHANTEPFEGKGRLKTNTVYQKGFRTWVFADT